MKIYFDLLNTENDSEVLMSLLYAIGHNNKKLGKEQIKLLCSFIENDNRLVKEGLVAVLLGIDNTTAIENLNKTFK